ncbi:MAG: hypothetical protein KatS3mg087_2125 [Patescibacteria group bacterium]|nr:MAG: hypothetical protein KatS3mg087_2125 [Patescibacteria group bacterium]
MGPEMLAGISSVASPVLDGRDERPASRRWLLRPLTWLFFKSQVP